MGDATSIKDDSPVNLWIYKPTPPKEPLVVSFKSLISDSGKKVE